MRLPRVRLTIRGLLAIVALVAVALGSFLSGVHWERRRVEIEEARMISEFPATLGPPASK